MMKQYLKLLMAREGKEVLGKKASNLWLLTLVLVATFASIAFSEGSMNYLHYKMEDPFTNWVDIPIKGDNNQFKSFEEAINDAKTKQKYGFDDVHGDREEYYDMEGGRYYRCRHFGNINSSLIHKILDADNVVEGCKADTLVEQSLGVIITADALHRLGYSLNPDSVPAYIKYKAYNHYADTLGLKLVENEFYEIPWPILAVVRRLPNNVDMMATNYLSEQPNNDIKYPFDFNKHLNYFSDLLYFIPAKKINKEESEDIPVEQITEKIKKCFPDSIGKYITCSKEDIASIATWKKGEQVKVGFGEHTPKLTTQQWLAIDAKIQKECAGIGIQRIFDYETNSMDNVPDKYISLSFNTLDHIRDFEEFAKSEYQVQIDMSQVASKENFNAVTVMAAILSAAMVIFSMVCIIMFMVNMLQSYFQKVKRNIGTFKAFGMNASELIQVYTIILIMIVCSAVIMALVITYIIQLILPLVGIAKDGFNYLSLWNTTTYVAAIVVLISTIATVAIVMSRMLRQTPGDLIYDRN